MNQAVAALAAHSQRSRAPALPVLSASERLELMIEGVRMQQGFTFGRITGLDAMSPTDLSQTRIAGTVFEPMAASLRERGFPVEGTVASVMAYGWLHQGHAHEIATYDESGEGKLGEILSADGLTDALEAMRAY
jgi:hypothetical protein